MFDISNEPPHGWIITIDFACLLCDVAISSPNRQVVTRANKHIYLLNSTRFKTVRYLYVSILTSETNLMIQRIQAHYSLIDSNDREQVVSPSSHYDGECLTNRRVIFANSLVVLSRVLLQFKRVLHGYE